MKKQKKFNRIITTLISFQKQYIKKQKNIMKITKTDYNNKHKNCYRSLPEKKRKKKDYGRNPYQKYPNKIPSKRIEKTKKSQRDKNDL